MDMLHYISCGLDNIWLINGYDVIDTPYGKATSIHNIEGLHKAIGLFLVNNKPQLDGSEIRFLRKELDLSQVNLAELLGVSESSVRAWENDRYKKAPAPAEKMLRVLYQEKINGHENINRLLERISQLNRDIYQNEKILLEETRNGWKQAA